LINVAFPENSSRQAEDGAVARVAAATTLDLLVEGQLPGFAARPNG
jgi:hypothetical protein